MLAYTIGNEEKTMTTPTAPFTRASHIFYRSDFRNDEMWFSILEMHGIHWSEKDGFVPEEISLHATVEYVT